MKQKTWIWIAVGIVLAIPLIIAVVAIVGILVGLLYPATTSALKRAEITHAENTVYNLKHAIAAFHVEYGNYPLLDSDPDLTMTDHALMDIVLGSDKQNRNPRRIAFYTDQAAKAMGGGRFRQGVTLDAFGGGELWDPWGNFYRVRFDTDGNRRVENPDPAGPANFLPESIILWSAGPDGDFDTWEDNITSW